MRGTLLIALGLFVACLPVVAHGDEWPQFRGPNGSATSAATQLPAAWGADKNVAWKAKVPGYGWSSPIIWGDKVFLTTAITDNQRKPASLGGFGGRPGQGRPGGFRGFPQPGQILSPFLQERLNLTDEQKKRMEELQKEVDGKVDKILTDEQKKQLKEMREAPGGFRGFPQPGRIFSSFLQEQLNLTAEQKKQVTELQKGVDGKLDKILADAQRKQLKAMRENFGRGLGGFLGFLQPNQVLSPFLQERLNLTAEQKKQLQELQKEVDGQVDKILTDAQKKQLKETRPGFGRGGPGGFRGFPQPGQILPPSLQESLKLTDEQKKQREELQKQVDARLDKILTAEQNKQFKEIRDRFSGGGFGGMQRPPDAIYKLEVYCLDRASGQALWHQTAREGKPTIPAQMGNTYATETPVTDGERVYAYFGMHGVFCYDVTGKLVWKVDLGSYPMAMGYGTGSSPALADGRLFIQCDNEKKSFLVALDAKTGKELWRVARPERTGWSTPLIWKNKVRTEVVCLGSPRVRSYDPATGKQLWELGGMIGQAKASPVASSELLYVGTGGGPAWFDEPGGPGGGFEGGGSRPLFAVKAGASGDITLKEGAESNDGIAWYLPKAGPQTASPLLYEGYLYVLEERSSFLSCSDAKTGEQVYKERLRGARGFTSSPWACDGKIFCLDDSGTTFIIRAGAAFNLLGKSTLDEMCWSSPAVASGALFLRTADYLYCIKQKSGEK
jgi:outer membrane protein assembly factor BamB